MLCEKCLKNEATVRYEERINGVGKKLDLCHECAEEMGVLRFSNVTNNMENMMNDFMGGFIEDMLSPFMENDMMLRPRIGVKNNYIPSSEKCPRCGYTRDYYSNNGKGGCPECYGKFDTLYEKTNKVENPETKLKELEKELESCIKIENYEQAAKIRDKIKEIKDKNDKKE